MHEHSRSIEYNYDISGLKFSNIGKYISQLLKKIPTCSVYDFFSTDGITYMSMTFQIGLYERFEERIDTQETTVHIEMQEKLDSTFFEYYRIYGIYELYLFINQINTKHGIKNKNYLNIYDIVDLLEEFIIRNSWKEFYVKRNPSKFFI